MLKFNVVIAIIILIGVQASSKTLYSFPGNGFASLTHVLEQTENIDIAISQNELSIDNASSQEYLLQDSTSLPYNYTYSIIIANLNNTPKKNKTTSTWGIAFDIDEQGNKKIIELKSNNNDAYNDISTKQEITISLIDVKNGESRVVTSTKLDKSINLYQGHNTLTLSVHDNTVTLLMGRKKTKKVFEAQIVRDYNRTHLGILAGKGAKVSIQRALISYSDDNQYIVKTKWTSQELDDYFTKSVDPVEGYWVYLDRDLEDKIVKLGGKYRIALVKNENNGYDIIYLDGAQVNKSNWTCGLLKGKLYKTIFSGTYTALWIDSTFEPLSDDVQATIENGVILAIKLPVLKSQLRFSKEIE